jgi:hypothetical protein
LVERLSVSGNGEEGTRLELFRAGVAEEAIALAAFITSSADVFPFAAVFC